MVSFVLRKYQNQILQQKIVTFENNMPMWLSLNLTILDTTNRLVARVSKYQSSYVSKNKATCLVRSHHKKSLDSLSTPLLYWENLIHYVRQRLQRISAQQNTLSIMMVVTYYRTAAKYILIFYTLVYIK
jgi:hypothetical protein